jgi:type I restriction enzyme S subunit
VKLSDLEKHRIALPPLPEQRKIASVLYAVDQAIQKTEAIIEQAKRVKRGLMQDLLQRSRSSSGEVEGSWQQLGEVTEWKSGSTPSKGNDTYWGGTTPWVSAKDMNEVKLDGAEDHLTPEGVDEFGRLAPRGSLLVLVRGMRLKDSFPVCLVREEMAFNQDVKALTPRKGLDGEFLAYWLKANQNRILGLVTSASHGTKRLGTESLKNFRVWIPPEEYQRETVHIFRAFDQKIQGERANRKRLSQIKKGLMQDLLTGEVRTADKAIEVLDEVAAHG